MRAQFFGPDASTRHTSERLRREFDNFIDIDVDIRDADGVDRVFAEHSGSVELIIHTAAQPSHDWAAREPHTDFGVNALGDAEPARGDRKHTPDAPFIFTSTNKVYGDTPNFLPLVDTEKRLELPADHRWYGGVDTTMSIDHSTHSLFGVSKASADLMVQEYGRYFHMPTVCFRGRMPDRTEPRRRTAPRVSGLLDARDGFRDSVHRRSDMTVNRCVTTSMRTTW